MAREGEGGPDKEGWKLSHRVEHLKILSTLRKGVKGLGGGG